MYRAKMAKLKRYKTDYPGVYYIEGKAIGSDKIERIYCQRSNRWKRIKAEWNQASSKT